MYHASLHLWKLYSPFYPDRASYRRHSMVGVTRYWRQKRDFQIRFLRMNGGGLRPEHYFLDIGCGTLRGGIPLINYLQTGHYCGIEVRKHILEEARKELQQHNLEKKNPTLLHTEDISRLRLNRKYDRIWAFSVLIHMDDNTLKGTLDFVRRHLTDDGVFYANVNTTEIPAGTWNGFPMVWRPLEFYRGKCEESGLILHNLGGMKNLGDCYASPSMNMLKIIKK